jgi:lysophospholipase L1-like esterase
MGFPARSAAAPLRPNPSPGRPWWFPVVAVAAAIILGLAAGEMVIRLKNHAMSNYDIEMWRYSKELKERSSDPVLDFEHKPDAEALLQSVRIRINDAGLRGGPVPPPQPGQRRILFLGSSITLGWGVPEDETFSARVERALAEHGVPAVVMNGGIGNYNATRYVHRFLTRLTGLAPTDIVVQAFVRDGEVLEPADASLLLRNSELAMTLWIASHRVFDRTGQQALEDHYRAVYQPDGAGVRGLDAAYAALAGYARAHGIRLYMVMTPDVHNLKHYQLQFVHEIFAGLAARYGYRYLDLRPFFGALTPEELWAMPGDPHPNARGHEIMARALVPVLLETGAP